MKYHNTLIHNKRRGFTLIEIVLVIAIMGILAAATTPYTVSFYKRFQLDSERNKFVSLLRQARTMSMAGENSQIHGIYITSSQFIIFEGATYATRDSTKDQTFSRESGVTISGSGYPEFKFNYLTGKTASKSWTLDNTTKNAKVTVNSEGRIDWR